MRRMPLLLVLVPLALVGCESDRATGPQSAAPGLDVRQNAESYELIDLGTFDGAETNALGIDKHLTVVGRYASPSGMRSFRRTRRGGFEDLGDIGGRPFLVLDTNDHGMLNGSVVDASGIQRAAAWVPRRGFVLLDPDHRGSTLGSNDKGAIAGTRILPPGGAAAFVWAAGRLDLVPVTVPDGTVLSSRGSDVNERGAVAGTLNYLPSAPGSTPKVRAFVWDRRGGTRLIPPLGPGNVGVTYISDEGIVVGAAEMELPSAPGPRPDPVASNPGPLEVHAWKWSRKGGLVDLGTLGGRHSVAWDADRFGNVYGWASDAAGVQHAVKWTANGDIVVLGTLGERSLVGGLNKHGVVAGWSVDPAGEMHAVMYLPK